MTDAELKAGGEIAAYRLVREIGRGAVGVVFDARTADDRRIALKIVAPPPLLPESDRDSLRARFFREARALTAVDHPNVVRVFDAGEADGRLYLAMEFLDGENLRRRLTNGGRLPPEQAVALVLQLCSALEAVHHAGIIHRDVKPENVIVLADGLVKLADFGVAWMENEATLTRTGGVLGSPAYMSPEQILGRNVDRRSDLFSAAATLYQLLANRLPFDGTSLLELAHNVAYAEATPLPPDIPYPLARAVMQGLQKSPVARFGNAAEFAHALRATLPRARPPRLNLQARAAAVPAEGTLPAVAGPVPAEFAPAGTYCPRHPSRAAAAHCAFCGRGLCRLCVRGEREPYYCALHRPVTIFGINTVRLEVLAVAITFLLLLWSVSPFALTLWH